jgi:hypothetical protein
MDYEIMTGTGAEGTADTGAAVTESNHTVCDPAAVREIYTAVVSGVKGILPQIAVGGVDTEEI